MKKDQVKQCNVCGKITCQDSINKYDFFWTASGVWQRGVDWHKDKSGIMLCEDCEDENFMLCSELGCYALIENWCVGLGYEIKNEDDLCLEHYCPVCAYKEGVKFKGHVEGLIDENNGGKS